MTTLPEIADLVYGYPFPASGFRLGPNPAGLPVVRIRDVVRGRSNTVFVGPYEPTYIVENGDMLIGMDGEFNLAIWQGGRALLNQRVCKVVPRPSKVEPRYLYWALPRELKAIEARTPFVTVKHLSARALSAIDLSLPTLTEQRRIADILDRADAIRRKRKEAVALTEELLGSAFLEIVGPVAADYVRWPVRTVGSLAARTPNSMRTGPFGSDLLHSEFVDEGIAVLGIDNAVQNRFAWGERRFITPEKYNNLRRYTVIPGDIIVTIMGTTGRSAVVPDDIPTAITTKHLATITLDRNEAEPEFVSQALFRHPEVLRQIAAANHGAIMSGLNLGLIKALRIPVPPPARQREFARVTARIRGLERRMENDGHEEKLFRSLVARAFSGQLKHVEAPC